MSENEVVKNKSEGNDDTGDQLKLNLLVINEGKNVIAVSGVICWLLQDRILSFSSSEYGVSHEEGEKIWSLAAAFAANDEFSPFRFRRFSHFRRHCSELFIFALATYST